MSRPPAATNGIMYDTPVISTRRTVPPHEVGGGGRAGGVGGALDAWRRRVVGRAQRLGDHRVGVVHRPLHARADQGETGESLPVAHADVDGEDRGLRLRDHLDREWLGAHRALGLDGEVDAGPLGGGLQRLGGHVGVRDAGGARGDGDQPAPTAGRGRGDRPVLRSGRCRGRGGRSRGGGGLEHLGHESRRLLGRGGCAQRRGEVGLHQCPGELGEQLHVGVVAALGRQDQERQVGRSVLRAEVHGRREPRQGDGRLGHPRSAAVRDGDPAG